VVVWSALIFVVQAALIFVAMYQIFIAFAGLLPSPNIQKGRERLQRRRFLCITAAHNESKVIKEHVLNLLSMNYPRDLYDVVVIADNCFDETAEIARLAGATVWERINPTERGKGYALKWALHEQATLSDYDAVCVFDADNLVAPNFLEVMEQHLDAGYKAVQAYLDSKNAWDSWVSNAYAFSYWFMNRFWQRARVRLGLSGALGGTGFCLSTELLSKHRWEALSLTEDLEYTVRLIMHNERVFWTPMTRVFDEKPTRLKDTFPQRTRWLKGHWSTAFKYSKPLIRNIFAHRSIAHSIRSLDTLVYLWQPLVILLTAVNYGITLGDMALGHHWYFHWITGIIPYRLWIFIVLVGFFLPLFAVGLEDVRWKAFVYYPLFLVFNLTWIPVTVKGLVTHKNQTWIHTKHDRSMTLNDVFQGGV
jgi:cellulose synthase/poly-beta-1,6-N-acetylglucosamine synthase-like glycosyltransferase